MLDLIEVVSCIRLLLLLLRRVRLHVTSNSVPWTVPEEASSCVLLTLFLLLVLFVGRRVVVEVVLLRLILKPIYIRSTLPKVMTLVTLLMSLLS